MPHRLLKQLLYGVLYLAIFGVIGASVYFVYIKAAPTCTDGIKNQGEEGVDCGGPCIPCAIKKLKPVKALPPQLFDAGNGKTTILFRVQNPNLHYAASRFLYDVSLFDNTNKRIFFIADESFVYAGSEKVIVLPAVDVPFAAIAASDITAHDPEWTAAEALPKPNLGTRDVKIQPGNNGVAVTGFVQNNNSYALNNAAVNAVVSEKSGLPINASNTVLGTLAPFEQRPFSVFIPLSKTELSALDESQTSVTVDARR